MIGASAWLTAAGLTADIAGVVLLGYDLFRGPVQDWLVSSYQEQLRVEQEWRDRLRQRMARLQHPTSAQPDERVDVLDGGAYLQELMRTSEARLTKLEKEARESDRQFIERARYWGWRGIALACFGFTLQLVAALLPVFTQP